MLQVCEAVVVLTTYLAYGQIFLRDELSSQVALLLRLKRKADGIFNDPNNKAGIKKKLNSSLP